MHRVLALLLTLALAPTVAVPPTSPAQETPMKQENPGAGEVGAARQEAPLTPSAYDASDDIFYQFMPIAWRYGESPDLPAQAKDYRFGNFQGMIDSLPYLKGLGVTAVWMTPIFPSPAYHGYQHGPADQLNPWFGSEADFLRFVREAKAQGIKVYLDLVAYGISQETEFFKDAYKNPKSPYAAQLAFTNDQCTKFLGHSYTSWNGNRVTFINWDLRSPEARQRVIVWSKHWLDPNNDGDPSDGIAGYRLDHVVPPMPPTVPPTSPAPSAPSKPAAPAAGEVGATPTKAPPLSREALEASFGYDTAFWLEWKHELQKVNPTVFTFAEQAKWETTGADLLAAHDAAFTKPFEAAAREALKSEDATKLYESMAATLAALPKGRTFLCTLGDHDVDRLASAIGADEHEGRARAAAAVLMLSPLPPVIYMGDELGMRGKSAKLGGDANDIPRREPFTWNAVAGPPMSNYFALHEQAYEKRSEHDHDGRSVEEQDQVPASLLSLYRELAQARAEQPALRRGTYTPRPCPNKAVWWFTKTWESRRVEVAVNLSGKEVLVARPEGGKGFALQPYGWVVLPLGP
jgi:alpha-amylase